MRSSMHAASLLALALTLAPIAMAEGEGHSCCAADKNKKQTVGEKCDPKTCPPGKCDKNSKNSDASKKVEVKKTAPKNS